MKKTTFLLLSIFGFIVGFAQHSLDLEPDIEEKLQTLSLIDQVRLLESNSQQRIQENPELSLRYARRAHAIAFKSQQPEVKVLALKVLGNWHLQSNIYLEAIKYYLEALSLEPQLKEKSVIANILNNIGMVYWRMEEYHKSLDYHNRALALRKKIPSSAKDMGFSLNNLGLVMIELGKFQECFPHLLEALKLFRSAGDKRGEAAALNNLASCYLGIKNYPMALTYYQLSQPVYKSINLKWGAANAKQNIGVVYYKTGRYKQARKTLLQAIDIALEIDAKKVLYDTYFSLSELCVLEKKYQEALTYYKEYTKTKSALINETNSKLVTRLNSRYDANQKDTRIQFLLKQRQLSRQVRLFLLSGIFLALITLVLLYNRYRTRQKINRQVEANEAKYRALYSQAGDAIFLMDNESFIDCNEKALEMFKASREWIIGKTFADISPKKQPGEVNSLNTGKEYIEKAFSGTPQSFYWKHIRSDYTLLDTTVNITAIFVNGRRYIQAIVHDITHRQQLEMERIKNEKLEAIRQLSGGIAHDLNNLLAILVGNLDLAKLEVAPGSSIDNLLDRMEEVTQSATQLSQKFIIFADSGVGGRRAESIAPIMRDVVQNSFKGLRVQCTLQVAKELKPVHCNIDQIRQVLVGITSNAVDAMHDCDGFQIEVIAKNVFLQSGEVMFLTGGEYVYISIRDNGEGISSENLDRIFDPYFTTRERYNRKGSGMGLSLAQSIIKRHDGNILVTSQLGKGTLVEIYLPAVEEEKIDPKSQFTVE
jgi:PAS domain S-box-containing protein